MLVEFWDGTSWYQTEPVEGWDKAFLNGSGCSQDPYIHEKAGFGGWTSDYQAYWNIKHFVLSCDPCPSDFQIRFVHGSDNGYPTYGAAIDNIRLYPRDECQSQEHCEAEEYCQDAGICVNCIAGVCCDAVTGQFHLNNFQCSTTPQTAEYRCDGSGCGADAQRRAEYQYCTGDSADCGTDNLIWSDWHTIDNCLSTELCQSNSTNSWCTESASCE